MGEAFFPVRFIDGGALARQANSLLFRFRKADIVTAPPATATESAASRQGTPRLPLPSALLPGPFAAWEALSFPAQCVAVGLFWCVVSFLFYAPPLFVPIYPDARIVDLMKLTEHPLRRDLFEPILAYRLSTPLIGYLLHVHGLWIVVVQYLANVAFLSLLFAVFCQRTSRRLAFFGVALIALSQAGQVGNTWIGYQDSLAHLCATACMFTAGPAIAPLAVIAGLADERFVLAAPFVALWHLLPAGLLGPLNWRKALKASVFMGLGVAVVLVIRRMITTGVIGPGLELPPPYRYIGGNIAAVIGPPVRHHPFRHLAAAFFAFRWLWALPILILWTRPAARIRWLTILTVGALGIGSVAVWWGGDHTRSEAFMFPAFIWMIIELPRLRAGRDKVLLILLIAMMVTPQVNPDYGRKIGWVRPFPVVAMRLITGADPVTLLRRWRHAGTAQPAQP